LEISRVFVLASQSVGICVAVISRDWLGIIVVIGEWLVISRDWLV
jgi:hypothetical protein